MEFNKFLEDFKKEYGYTYIKPKVIGMIKYIFDAFENNDTKRIEFIEKTICEKRGE